MNMNVTTMLDYGLVQQAKERELKLLIRLKAPAGMARKRKPLNLGVVIDRSGSMAGDKIENTKLAIKTLITHLGPDDYLSLVQFDDAVQVLLEPTPVKDKDALKQLVDRIDTGGSTNLSAGWLQGLKLVGQNANDSRINRCLLLTDGQANVGIQDNKKLAFLGKSARQNYNVVTTTLGFGEGFNEDLLTAIAKDAGGAFYFVDKAEDAPAIFTEELQGLLRLVAQNIEVNVLLESPVRLMMQWTDYPAVKHKDGISFSLGDAYAEEEKNLLLSMWIPSLPNLGPSVVANLDITFAEISEKAVSLKQIRHEVRVNVGDEYAAQEAKPEVEVQQQFGLQLAARARKQAIEEADAGDYQKAERSLRQAAEQLDCLPDPNGMLREEIADLQQQAGQFDTANYTRNRKVMSEVAFSASMGKLDNVRASRARRQSVGDGTRPRAKTQSATT
jgi:Ca-activated chloride channel family protein